MTKAQREAVQEVIAQVVGYEVYMTEGMTEAQCEQVCEACPFAGMCGKAEMYYGCEVWEEAMGEDL